MSKLTEIKLMEYLVVLEDAEAIKKEINQRVEEIMDKQAEIIGGKICNTKSIQLKDGELHWQGKADLDLSYGYEMLKSNFPINWLWSEKWEDELKTEVDIYAQKMSESDQYLKDIFPGLVMD